MRAIPFVPSWADPGAAWTYSSETAVETVAGIYHRDHLGWILAVVMTCEMGSET